MSGLSEIWAELGIEPTSDIKKIKKAYARQVAKYHPEEQPERFQKVYHAYEAALRLAKAENQTEYDVHEGRPGDEPSVVSDNEESFQNGKKYSEWNEQQQWRAAEKINTMAEKYAREEERLQTRKILYDCFLTDIVLDKTDTFANARKMQSHEKWNDYLQDPLFLEAVHIEGFLSSLVNKIRKLQFQPKTIKMVKDALEREASYELENQKKLCRILEEKVQSSKKEQMTKLLKGAVGVIFACLLVLMVFRGVQNSKERLELEKLRAPKNMEAYVNEKYHISSDVSPSNSMGLYGKMSFTDDKDTEYFEVDTLGSEGVPERFHLAWDRASRDYEEIQDDLEYEIVKMYASTFELSQDNLHADENIIQIVNEPLEEFEPKFLNFLNALQKSKFVQDGYSVEIKVQPSFMYSEQVSVTVDKETEINIEDVSAKLKKCTENSIFNFNQQQ